MQGIQESYNSRKGYLQLGDQSGHIYRKYCYAYIINMIFFLFIRIVFVVDNITTSVQIGQVANKFLILTLSFDMF